MQAQQQQQSVPKSASRAAAFAAPNDLPQFNWQPPSQMLTENAPSLVANPLTQIQQPAETNLRDPMIGVHAAAPMAFLQQVTAAQQNAVHFASPLQQVYNLSPTSSAATDPRLAQHQNVFGTMNPNAAPFN